MFEYEIHLFEPRIETNFQCMTLDVISASWVVVVFFLICFFLFFVCLFVFFVCVFLYIWILVEILNVFILFQTTLKK